MVSTAKRLRECCGRVGRVGEEGMPSRTVGERVGRVGERGIPLAKSVRRKRVWGEKCEHVPGVGARWGREGGEEGADTVHTLVSENEARARWERLQSFFYDISRVPSGEHTRPKTREWGPLLREAPAVLRRTRRDVAFAPRRLLEQGFYVPFFRIFGGRGGEREVSEHDVNPTIKFNVLR